MGNAPTQKESDSEISSAVFVSSKCVGKQSIKVTLHFYYTHTHTQGFLHLSNENYF